MQRSEDLRFIHAAEATVLSSAQANGAPSLLPTSLDPLYGPLLEAVQHIRQTLDSQHQAELEALKRSTANQTEALYHRLSEAREHFVSLERDFEIKISELAEAQHTIHQQESLLATQAHQLEQLEQERSNHQLLVDELNQKHEQLLAKLKEKIEAIHADFQQQIDNLQSKLAYQKIHHEEQVDTLSRENLALTHELHNTRREYLELHQTTQESRDKISQLEQELNNAQLLIKDKNDRLQRSEHSLKLAHEELERNQRYVQELEDKNNSIQKELFENWIVKKDEL